jgi:acyl-coenzyme A thioesterase PaaI-like protein
VSESPPSSFAWIQPPPGRLVGRGHPAGDFLEAYEWTVLDEEAGWLLLDVHLPAHVRNPRGQLFGGFTPTYVDFVALFTVRAGADRRAGPPATWLATTSMRLDYFEPVTGPRFVIDSRIEKSRGRTHVVLTRFVQDGDLAVLAATTMREQQWDRVLGDG